MEPKKRGGARKGAGRKPADSLKEPVTLYIEKKDMWVFGGKEKMKKEIFVFIKNRQLDVKSQAPLEHPIMKSVWPSPQPTAQKTELQFLKEISELEFEQEYREKAAEIKAATYLGQKAIDRLLLNLSHPKN